MYPSEASETELSFVSEYKPEQDVSTKAQRTRDFFKSRGKPLNPERPITKHKIEKLYDEPASTGMKVSRGPSDLPQMKFSPDFKKSKKKSENVQQQELNLDPV
jgi:hypothetical protein